MHDIFILFENKQENPEKPSEKAITQCKIEEM